MQRVFGKESPGKRIDNLNESRSSSFNPAILGVPRSYGIKHVGKESMDRRVINGNGRSSLNATALGVTNSQDKKHVVGKECMDKRNENSIENGSSSINAAILGVPSSHDIKLPPNISLSDKQQLMIELHERRRSRLEKLETRIMAKQKVMEKPKVNEPLPPKTGSTSNTTENMIKGNQYRESVFMRLYKNSSSSRRINVNGTFVPPIKPNVPLFVKPTPENSVLNKMDPAEVAESNISVVEQNDTIENTDLELTNTSSTVNKQLEMVSKDTITQNSSDLGENKQMENIPEGSTSLSSPDIEVKEIETISKITTPQSSTDIGKIKEMETIIEETITQGTLDAGENKEMEIACEEIMSQNNLDVGENKRIETIVEETSTKNTFEVEESKELTNDALNETFTMDPVTENNDNAIIENEKSESTESPTLTKEADIAKDKSQVEIPAPNPEVARKDSDFVLPTNSLPTKKASSESTISQVQPKNQGPKPKHQMRRSLSMLFRQKSRTSTISRASSDQSLNKPKKSDTDKYGRGSSRPALPVKHVNPKPVKSVSFESTKNKFLSSTVLRNQLEDWLNLHGHSSKDYRHLRCFGVIDHLTPKRVTKRTTTEVVETPTKEYVFDESDKENLTPPSLNYQANEDEVENWLKELYKLIIELKYPEDRCEEWLEAIRKKCSSCTQIPLYWECRAALDESKGDVQSAIENYQTAIIKGKDIESVGDSLANMFDKLVLEQKKPSKSKIEKGIDPKNIFKSTVVKFALQQKNTKESGVNEEPTTEQKNLVVTPVRRSSRIRTPSKQHVVSSLQSFTPEVRKKMTFKLNKTFLE